MRHALGSWVFVVLALAAAGCVSGDRPTPMDDGGGVLRCDSDDDCNDMQACTIDTCGFGGMCTWTALDERCGAGESCVIGRGCIAGTICTGPADCDDTFACTIDSCGVGGMCTHTAVNERCDVAAGEMCQVGMGCVAGTGCTSDAGCDDSIACTLDTCGVDMMCRHMTLNERCNTAAGEVCSAVTGCYVPMPCETAAECDDGNFCNGDEICTEEFGCAPAESPRMCNDSNACTRDSCDTTANACAFQCDPTLGPTCMAMCPPPTEGCAGRFTNTGTTTITCSGILGECVRVDLSSSTFEVADGVLTVRPAYYGTMPPVAGGLPLSDSMDPICPMFDVSATVDGGCREHYRIYGMFTDDDHFTATVEWSFDDVDGFSCSACGCANGSGTITGTRAP